MKVYYFGTHFTTTSDIIESGYINCFDITEEQALLIEQGSMLSIDGDRLLIDGEFI